MNLTPRCGLAHLWEPGLEMQACQEPVEPNPQAALKSPAEYVMMATKGSFTKKKKSTEACENSTPGDEEN